MRDERLQDWRACVVFVRHRIPPRRHTHERSTVLTNAQSLCGGTAAQVVASQMSCTSDGEARMRWTTALALPPIRATAPLDGVDGLTFLRGSQCLRIRC